MREWIVDLVGEKPSPLNLVIEAPLSVTFDRQGNPTGRKIEKQDGKHRYWYEGLGCLVTTGALYLIRAINDANADREARLFEGFVSFKSGGSGKAHEYDVEQLRMIVRNPTEDSIYSADQFEMREDHRIQSAFLVAGRNCGIPAVLMTK
jgi:hypothetical protein